MVEVDVQVDVITVTAYKCTHCSELFSSMDAVLKHLDKCVVRAANTRRYVEDTDYGNAILKEGVAGC